MDPSPSDITSNHSPFRGWHSNYTPQAAEEQDSAYDADASGDSPMPQNCELLDESDSPTTHYRPFLPQIPSSLPSVSITSPSATNSSSSNVSISDSGISLATTSNQVPSTTKRKRKPKVAAATRFEEALKVLAEGKLAPIELLLAIANPEDSKYATYRARLYDPGTNLCKFLDLVMLHDNGRRVVMEWMRPYAMSQVCDSVQAEMSELDNTFCTEIKSITPALVRDWTMDKDVIVPIEKHAPSLVQVIRSAVRGRQSEKNKNKDNTRVCPSLTEEFQS